MNYSNNLTPVGEAGLLAVIMGLITAYILVLLLVAVFLTICLWRIFVKAGKPGWAAIVPIYNMIILLEIVGRPTWWVLLYFAGVIPYVGWIVALVVGVVVMIDLAKSFGKDTGYAILLILLPIVGYPLLAFGKDTYVGPAAAITQTSTK